MSNKGGSDLDVFKSLTKTPGQRSQTLLGVAVVPPMDGANGSAPPPPPSLRATHVSAIEDVEEVSIEEEIEEMAERQPLDAIEEIDAIGEDEFGFREDEHTNVFSLPGQSSTVAAAPEENAYHYSEPAWSPAAPPYAAPTTSLPPPSSSAQPPYQQPSYQQPTYQPSFQKPSYQPAPGYSGSPPVPPPVTSSYPAPPSPPSPSLPPLGANPSRMAPITSIPLPPPPGGVSAAVSIPPAPPPAPPQVSIGDWDDEDDKTTVYSRESGQHIQFGMLGTAIPAPSVVPGAPPPPMSRPSAPIPMQPSPSVPLPRPSPLPRDVLPPSSMPPTAGGMRASWVIGGGLLLALVGALVFLLLPRSGTLVVTVAGPGNKPIDKVEVLVDSKVVCDASPCTIKDLSAGTHLVRARATGYQSTADTAVPVTGGQDAVHNIKLDPDQGTGIKVSALGSGLRLWVDGKELGSLPIEVNDLSPGTHQLKITGDAFETHEQTVDVLENELISIGPLKLKVAKGLARILPGDNAQGARFVLETGDERKAIPQLPINLQIDTSKKHVLIATKPGFETYREELTFEDGEPERTFDVSLQAATDSESSDTPPAAAAPAPRSSPAPRAAPAPAPAPRPSPAPAATGNGTLNINAVPKASVLLDGRPIGTTPKIGVSVGAGVHTVIFVKDGQRVSKSINVRSGATATVVHRF